MAVGIGREIKRAELQKIAGSENVLMVKTFDQLEMKLNQLEEMTCGKFALGSPCAAANKKRECSWIAGAMRYKMPLRRTQSAGKTSGARLPLCLARWSFPEDCNN